MTISVTSPIAQFFDLDGTPLDSGYLYFGLPSQNPETDPTTVYWDSAGTQPCALPIRTRAGYPTRNGTPANIYASGDYSLTVKNKSAALVFYSAVSSQFASVTPVANGGTGASTAAGARTNLGITPANIGASPRATRLDVASVAGTVDLTTNAPNTDDIRITGTLAITGFTVATDRVLRVTAGGAFTLTNGAGLVTQTGANIVVAAGDTFMLRATAANTVEVLNFTKAVFALGQIQSLPDPTLSGNAMTLPASTHTFDFRSATLTTGVPTTVSGTAAALVIPAGATLGTVNAIASTLIEVIMNNGGTLEKAIVNLAGGNDLSETGVISTTAISAGATSANVFYSTTARSNLAYRVVRSLTSTQATAGQWATPPSLVQGCGGQALAAMSSLGYGQTIVSNGAGITRALGATQYNTTGKPIVVYVGGSSAVSYGYFTCSLNGGAAKTIGATGWIGSATNYIGCAMVVIPPWNSYVINMTAGTLGNWDELR